MLYFLRYSNTQISARMFAFYAFICINTRAWIRELYLETRTQNLEGLRACYKTRSDSEVFGEKTEAN